MRPVREITAEEEDFRMEPMFSDKEISSKPFLDNMEVIRRNPIEPEPVGTVVLVAFRITGYDQDCDGSLMARLVQIGKDGKETGWSESSIGLYPETELVVGLEEWQGMFDKSYTSTC